MKFARKISTLMACIVLSGTMTVSANQVVETEQNPNNNINIKEVSVNEWNEYKEEKPQFLLNSKNASLDTYSDLQSKMKNEDSGLLLHNNGNPIETNLSVDQNDGYPLFAVYIDNIEGKEYMSYYYANVEKRDYNELVEEVINTENKKYEEVQQIYSKNRAIEARSIIKNVSWSLYDSSNKKRGVVSTTLEGTKKSATIDSKKGSVWDISTVSQAEMSRSGDTIKVQRTRLSLAASSTEQLIDWAPDMNGTKDKTFTLSGVLNPMEWKFSAGGYHYKDLSSKDGRYGRWEFWSPGIARTKVKTNPAIRASNLKGQFYVEASHYVYSISGVYQPGIKGIYFTDM